MSALEHLPAAGVRVDGVSVAYGRHRVLDTIDLDIRPGEFFAFLGPSGCGKTTLLRVIAGFVRAGAGRVWVGDRDVAGLPPWRRDVGLVFQSYALWPHMSVRRNVAFGLEERGWKRAAIAERVEEALSLVGLGALADRYPAQLSGGQQQRVALARTVAVRPKVLLLDEPLSNLDARLRVEVRRDLRALQRRLGITTIFVTHDQEEANATCDRIAVMAEGRVQQVGTPMELYRAPANLFVAGFLGHANILEGQVTGTGASRAFTLAGGATLPIPPGVDVPDGARLVVRPQDVALTSPEGAALAGTVRYQEFLGASVRYGIGVGAIEITADLPFRSGTRGFEPADRVGVEIDTGSALWLTA